MLHRGSNCLLVRAIDGCIMRYGIISSCQSVAISRIVKCSWACVHRGAALYQVLDLYLYPFFTYSDRSGIFSLPVLFSKLFICDVNCLSVHSVVCILCADVDDSIVMTAAARARRRRESRQRQPIGSQVSSLEHFLLVTVWKWFVIWLKVLKCFFRTLNSCS